MRQIYENYTEQDHHVWQLLFDRQIKQLPAMASTAYLEGIKKIEFTRDRIPNFDEINVLLKNITGWQVEVVKGLIPNKEFFELLEDKHFPASTWLRKLEQLDYLEEPDMFHDVFGHMPLLTNHDFTNFLKGFSKIALRFLDNEHAVEMIARLYWFTVEFGLIEIPKEGLKIYGAGILSSSGESIYCLGDVPQRVPYNVAEIVNTPYIKEKFQDKYYVINSYRQLFDSLPEIEQTIEKYVMVNS